jgi:hypothetical protein
MICHQSTVADLERYIRLDTVRSNLSGRSVHSGAQQHGNKN